MRFLYHTQRCTTVVRTPLDEWALILWEIWCCIRCMRSSIVDRKWFMYDFGSCAEISAIMCVLLGWKWKSLRIFKGIKIRCYMGVSWLSFYFRRNPSISKSTNQGGAKLSRDRKVLKKIKFHPITDHEGPEGEWSYSSTLSLTPALDGVGGQRHAPGRFTPGKGSVPFV